MSMGSRNSTISKGSHNSIYERNNSNMTQTVTTVNSGQNTSNGTLVSANNTNTNNN